MRIGKSLRKHTPHHQQVKSTSFLSSIFCEVDGVESNEIAHLVKMNKLSQKWEGTSKVIDIPHPNTYILEDKEGKKLKNNFNVENLKTFIA